jgi:hypothetical protein
MDEQLFISTKPSPDIILTIETKSQSTYESSANINMPGDHATVATEAEWTAKRRAGCATALARRSSW